jgi:hypothetical protein
MQQTKNHLLVARILSGCIRVEVEDFSGKTTLLITQPSRQQRYLAEELYQQTLQEAEMEGMYFNTEVLAMMLEYEIWDEDKNARLEGLKKDIEELKVGIFKHTFRANERRIVRSKLAEAKSEVEKLLLLRHSYDHLTCEGYANLVRYKYKLACGLKMTDNTPYYDGDFMDTPDVVLEQVLTKLNEISIADGDYRKIARTEPWRTMWNVGKKESSIFGVSSADMTEEQKSLMAWSSMYDSIYESPDCPHDTVIEDDDMLDGWLILQRRKREADMAKKQGDEQLTKNQKIANADEVYLVADTAEDAAKIELLNDDVAQIKKARRMNYLKQKGKVKELDFPDQQMRMREGLVQMMKENVNRTKR